MRALLISFVACLPATSVLADWQYTSWKMTLEQVIAASHGKAHAVNGTPGQRVFNADLKATGNYNAAGIAFRSQFFFDASNRLRVVKLLPIENSRCDDLKTMLEGIYGISTNTTNIPMFDTRSEWWLDTKNSMKVRYSSDTAEGGECWIVYSPLEATGASGL